MANANQDMYDAVIRHQIALRRVTEDEIRLMLDVIEQQDRRLVELIRLHWVNTDRRQAKLETILKGVRKLRDQLEIALVKVHVLKRAETFAMGQALFEQQIITDAIPFQMHVAAANFERVLAIATSRPFEGHLMGDWFAKLIVDDKVRLMMALERASLQGANLGEVIRTIAGTRANGYRDGILSVTRHNAEAIARTALTHISNAAREEVWVANQDIIGGLRWTSTLDGRTTAVCRSRDGKYAPVAMQLPQDVPALIPPDVRPPAHWQCRSVMVAHLDAHALMGNRPTVVDTRTRRKREIDFRAQAKKSVGKEKWRAMSISSRNALIKDVRTRWGQNHIGSVPSATTYEQFFHRQSAEFQKEVLGPTRYTLFKKGGLSLDQFVDYNGNTLTLKELMNRQPQAFYTGGLL